MYLIVVSDNTRSITYDLWKQLNKYNLQQLVLEYLHGGPIIPKHDWKHYIKNAVHSHEEQLYVEGLQAKGAHRFIRIHPTLTPYKVYNIIIYQFIINKILNLDRY